MNTRPRSTIISGIKCLDEQHFVWFHPVKIIPPVIRVIAREQQLANSIFRASFYSMQIFRQHTLSVTNGEGRCEHRVSDRSPHIHNSESLLQDGLRCLLAQNIANPLWSGSDRVVIVNNGARLPGFSGLPNVLVISPQGKVKGDDPRSTGNFCNQCLSFRKVVFLYFGFVVEIPDRTNDSQ